LLLGGALSGIALGVPAAAQVPASQAARYPLDPVCPWGRIADGHGLLVRCLERGEAQALLAAVAPPSLGAVALPAGVTPTFLPPGMGPTANLPPAAAPSAAVPSAAVPSAAVPSAAVPSAGVSGVALPPGAAAPPRAVLPTVPAVPAGSVPAVAAVPGPTAPIPPLAAVAPLAATAPRSTKIYRKVSVREVGAALADTGDLPEAQVQLRKVQDRYAQCIASNGGLEGVQGRVTVRFLVRERGRAEGVAVKERQGVSLAAAKCVAEVIDRRFVGYPAAPIVGASMSIDFIPEGAAR
jgi:hypothetical protein